MNLSEFLMNTRDRVSMEMSERMQDNALPYPSEELVFSEVVMRHMADVGITDEPNVCHFTGKVGNANLRLAGYAVSEDFDNLDLFVSLYIGADVPSPVSDNEVKQAAGQCLQFLTMCVEGKLAPKLDATNDAYEIATVIESCYASLDRIRIFVLTDRISKAKNFKSREVRSKTVSLEVMDLERLHRHWSEGKPRDELVVNFEELSGGALPCVYVPGQLTGYDYALAAIPAETLYALYEKFGPRLLEANVRSFLSATGKVNRGIRDTLRDDPEHFMAYNNGIVLIADEARLGRAADGSVGLSWLRGMQIVNGGQTTASIYFTKKKAPEVDLGRVRVPAKVIVLQTEDSSAEEQMISDISRYANSQNSVKQSDLSANKPFHVQFEKLADSTFLPDGVGRWFYERAAGSYNVLLAREGTTAAKLRNLKDAIPPARKMSKTDLARYYLAWAKRPHDVAYGTQKNFTRFMEDLAEEKLDIPDPLTVIWYKRLVAIAILYKAAQRLSRAKHFQQAQANIAAYLVSVISDRLGSSINLDRIWDRQEISKELLAQLEVWAIEVEKALRADAGRRMISEQAKRPECWNSVRSYSFSKVRADIPELA
ncbi:AIPR family protein [Sphingomonas carotinifaciens]|uniref:AIPR family protein n=1 Tax=Sphingomonas carotinifaciens TaxID=1166323 RepID=UPI00399FA651